MLNLKTTVLLLILIFFLATRFYKIDSIPPSLYWDEASIGYNAYSVLKTGHDEWGQYFPLEFKAFGEYKLPIYIYSVVPFLAIFGLHDWVVRIPSVIYSTLTILIIFLLSYKIFQDKIIALLSSFLLSISPWLFIFSRTGYEVNTGLMFYLLGIYLFLLSENGKRYIYLSVLSFIISMFGYNSFRIISPFTLLILNLVYFKTDKEYIKDKWPSLFLGLILFLFVTALTYKLTTTHGFERLQEIGIFNTQTKKELIVPFVKNYLSHFSPDFLIFKGDSNLRSQQPGFGQLTVLEVIFLLLGFLFIIRSKKWIFAIPLFLLLVSIIPAAITKESPHGLRSITVAPFISMITAFGTYQLYILSKSKIALWVLVFLFLISFLNYYKSFLTTYPVKSSDQWQYGYKKIFTDYSQRFSEYDQIIIADYYGHPYIFALLYTKYDPRKFSEEVERNTTRRKETSVVKKFNKFHFTSINFYDFPKGKSLIFAHPSERMDEIDYKETIKNLDGSLAFYVYEYEK